jgi:hypothetical protein
VSWGSISENVKVEPTNSTNAKEENIYSDSDVMPLLGGNCSTNSPSGKKFQKIKNMLERFFTNLVRPKGYPLMEGSHRPLGNKLAGVLKHSGNKLADMLGSIKNFSMNLFRVKNEPPINSILISVERDWALPMDSSGIIQLNNRKPLGNILADMLRSIKDFFVRHFKSKKITPEKQVAPKNQNNEPSHIRFNDCEYITCSGNRVKAVSGHKPNGDVKEPDVTQTEGYILRY